MTIINMAGGKSSKPIVVEAVEDTPSTLPHTYEPREGVDYLSSVTVGKDPNLVPGNIKKDVSIFGTVGTLESGGGGSGDCSDIFTVNGISIIADGYIGSLAIKVGDTPVSSGEYLPGYESGYKRTSAERIYSSEAGGWTINIPSSNSLGSSYFAFTLPEVTGGPMTVPLSSLDSSSPWRHLGPFTARGSWFHGNVSESKNVQSSIDPSELYYMELSCDGTNMTFNCPTLSSAEVKVGGYPDGANTNVYSAVYPGVVEVKII